MASSGLFRIGDGVFANAFAAVALVFSVYSFYQTSWRQPTITAFAPAVIEYSDPSNGVFDVFGVPLTFANSGARPGVVLSARLEATDPSTDETKTYYAAEFGRWSDAWEGGAPRFAPISIDGRGAETRTILFYPRPGETIDRLVKIEPATYAFTLTFETVAIDRTPGLTDEAGVQTIQIDFERRIDGVDYRAFQQGGALSLYDPALSASVSQ